MLVPAVHALALGEMRTAQVFGADAALGLLLALLLGLALAGRAMPDEPRRHLAGLLALFVALPLMLAMPFRQVVGNTTLLNAYVEMVSCLTTTGATLFDQPGRLTMPLHLWRATVGWLGGLFILVGAVAVLEPMALGGFEVRRRNRATTDPAVAFTQFTDRASLSERVAAHLRRLLPVYGGLTLVLWAGLRLTGEAPAVALIHAMSTLATSGISPEGGLAGGGAGIGGEAIVALFLIFGISRLTFETDRGPGGLASLRALGRDTEIRLATALALIVPAVLFLRHFVGAYQVEGLDISLRDAPGALWGAVFTVLSFLTTTGWASAGWETSQAWSGLDTPALILVGLALIGGGVATTAGGAKLLRVAALYNHGRRELGRLVYPHMVAGAGGEARHLRRQGAYMAWLFFMLMAVSAAGLMAAFALTGLDFAEALVLTISGLTTTGPLASYAAAEPISFASLGTGAKAVLTVAMILGRIDTLAIVALFSPALWRR
ncbi:MAG: TrkH family potassium uptake protein [Alphaproteobacteria bacterium]|nr:MAG: TrkH family potassium uptake protein [Alphaproteobacteria bacterium]